MVSILPEKGASRLLYPDDRHDFGKIKEAGASKLTYLFPIQNSTAREVKILDISTTCGCTRVENSPTRIPAGESVEIPVQVNWGGRVGGQSESIVVKTDHPEHGVIRFRVAGYVVPQLRVSPGIINFGDVRAGQLIERRAQFVVSHEASSDSEITGVIVENRPGLSATLVHDRPQVIEGDICVWDYRIRFEVPDEPGRVEACLMFSSSATSEGEAGDSIPLIVLANVTSALSATPSIVLFDQKIDREKSIEIRGISNSLTVEIEMPDTQSDSPFVATFAPATGADDRGRVLISYMPLSEGASGLVHATLLLRSGRDITRIPIVVLEMNP